jgi:outer membrane protein TolC
MSQAKPQSKRLVKNPRLILLPMAALILATFSGCAISPQPLSDSDRQTRIHDDINALFKDAEPLSGPLTLHDALARALKYNYDARLKLMEEALSNAQLDLTHYDLLPSLTAQAGYSSRNNDAGSSSVNLLNGATSPLFSGAQDRQDRTASATLSWNILDFGVSYVRTQQQASQTLMANERKRKAVQNIMQDVRQAYWRAYGAQNILPRLDVLLAQVNEALTKSRTIEEKHLMAPLDALNYQRSLIDLYQQIVSRRQELVLAKTELAALINVKPGTEIKLADKEEMKVPTDLRLIENLDVLDQAALANRPELREEDYRKQVTVLDARKALYSMLPGISFNTSINNDSNSYLYQNQWASSGATISFNLLRAFSYSSAKRAQKAQATLDDTRRIALSMAVLTQVRIAGQRYREAVEDYDITNQGASVDARIEKHMTSGVKAKSESDMTLLRSEVKAALSEMQRYTSFSNLQMAYGRVANSVGADMLPHRPQMANLKVFSQQLELAEKRWRNTVFKAPSTAQSINKVFVPAADVEPDENNTAPVAATPEKEKPAETKAEATVKDAPPAETPANHQAEDNHVAASLVMVK